MQDLSALLDSSPNWIMVFDRQGLCLFVNAAGLSASQLPEASLKGRPFRDFWPEDQQPVIDGHAQKALQGISGTCDAYSLNGSRKMWWRVSLSPVRDDTGKIDGFIAINTDITSLREVEENSKRLQNNIEQEVAEQSRQLCRTYDKLLLSRESFNRIEAELYATIENLPFDFFAIDRSGIYFLQNKVCRANWGNVLGKKPEEVAPDPETRRFWLDSNRRALSGEVVSERFERVVNGETRYGYNILAPIILDGKSEGVVGFNIDVTAIARAEEALAEKDAVLSSIGDNVPGIMLYQVVRPSDGSRRFTYVSESVRRLYGCSPEEAMDDPTLIYGRIAEEDRQRVLEEEEAAHASFVTFRTEVRMKNPAGDFRWSYFASRPRRMADGSTVWDGVEIDITEQRQVERALRESETKLRDIVETTSEWIWEIDAKGKHTFSNSAVEKILGYRPEEIIGRSGLDFICPEYHEMIADLLRDRSERKGWSGLVLCWRHRDGSVRYLESNAIPILDATGEVLGYRGSDRDITDRRKAEAALQESERKYRSIVESTDTGFVILDGLGKVLDANHEYVRLAGRNTLSEVLGHRVTEWTAAHDLERNRAEVEKCIRRGFVRNLEIDYVDASGRITPLEISATAIETAGSISIFGLCRDITWRRKVEAELKQHREHLEEIVEQRTRELTVLDEQLRQSQKLEAVGLLAGGIAHDFSNILAAIKGSIYLIQKKTEKDSPVRKYADQVIKSISRANNLTQELLAFSRRQMVVLKPRALNRIVRDMAALLSQVIGEHIELQVVLAEEDPPVMADGNQLEQVLLNLSTNARDAMPDGGILKIETEVVEMDESFLRNHGFGAPGKYASITVSDSGTGIDDTLREKIFEPFFTTKDTGKGSGLGLAVTYGIVKQHKGFISVESSRDRGSIFRIYLPVAETREEEQDAGPHFPSPEGSETILLAEDDPDALKTTAEILRMNGYRVLEAKDGEEALRLFREHKDLISLALLDVRMPGKNGREVYEAVRHAGSNTGFLFISGYTANIMDEAVIKEKNVDFISKIARPDEILEKIREMLDR